MVRALPLCALAALLVSQAFANTGDLKQTDVTTTEVSEAAEFAVQQINLQSNSIFAMILSSVVEASSQMLMVSGMKYTLVVEALPSTECRNNGELHTLCSCSVNTSKPVGYQVEVWVQAWMTPSMQLLSFKQVPLASENSIGGVSEAKTLTIASAISSSPAGFQQFLKTYTPSYCNNAVELSKRSGVFQDNILRIKKIQDAEQGTAKYGVTKFADLTESEFQNQNGIPMGYLNRDSSMKQAPPMNVDAAPTSFDWRDHGAVTPVKSQTHDCAAASVFASIANIEGQWAIRKGQLHSLSEQQLIDCNTYSQGCYNGSVAGAYKYARDGLVTETSYPFTGRKRECHFNHSQAVAYINGSIGLSTDEARMAAWLAATGPISISFNCYGMQFYYVGVSHPLKAFCNPEEINHAAVIVGYGADQGVPYWIIKNSWGADWGEEGYYRVYRGDGTCGVNRYPETSMVD